MSYSSSGMYEKYYHNGQFANWKTLSQETKVPGKYHLIFSMVLLFASLGIMVALAPLGICFKAPLSAWHTACQFEGVLRVTQGADTQLTKDNCDTLYEKADWQPAPKVFYPEAMKSHMYTVLVIDPDAPNHPNGTYYLHMLQANVLGEDLKAGNFGKALTIAPYVGPAPPKGTGDHRYMFVVYRHCKSIDRVPPITITDRYNFDLAKFFDSIHMRLIGPEAGLQFRAHY